MSFLDGYFNLPRSHRTNGADILLRAQDDEGGGGGIDRQASIGDFIENILNTRFKAFLLVFDAFGVLVLTSVLLCVGALRCEPHEGAEQVLEWCQPFDTAVDHVTVDFSFKLTDYREPSAVVAHAQNTMESLGFNYNFILANNVVYVGQGYQEGVDCGYIRPNYTMTAICPIYGEWCGSQNIRQLSWHRTGWLAQRRFDRKDWAPPAPPADHPFAVFDTDRVYANPYRLKACNASKSRSPLQH